MRTAIFVALCLLAGSVTPCVSAWGVEHPGIVGCSPQRTGYAPFELRPPYRALWVHRSQHKPRPAWPEPAWEPHPIDFDYAYAVSVDGDCAYYASSSDHALHALELNTGRPRWKFITDGPVRLAPDFHGSHVLFGSDDGFVYCLDRSDGRLVWKYRPEIPDRRMIGNEQMISRWPVRSGVLVEGDRVYATYGMLAAEGVAVCCLDAAWWNASMCRADANSARPACRGKSGR
jgi:hypothetical protein